MASAQVIRPSASAGLAEAHVPKFGPCRSVQHLFHELRVSDVPTEFIKDDNLRAQEIAPHQLDHENIPLIDMDALSPSELVHVIGKACEEWGFFKLVNHGIPGPLMEKMMAMNRDFFDLPLEEKTLVNSAKGISEAVYYGRQIRNDWRDILKITVYPEKYVNFSKWPQTPPNFRQILREYTELEKDLVMRLLQIISQALSLEKDSIAKICGEPAAITTFNYYPPSPSPNLTVGIQAHTDPNLLTLLVEDNVGGLQVCKDERWYAVPPTPNSIIVNVANQLQIISNGRFVSSKHRVPSSATNVRRTKATFMAPLPQVKIRPAQELIDAEHPARYPEVVVAVCNQGILKKEYHSFLEQLEAEMKQGK